MTATTSAVAWPGGQLSLYDGQVLAGTQKPWSSSPLGFGYAWDVNDTTGATVTLSAGDDVYVYSDFDRTLLQADTLGECNWIVDVTAQTAAVMTVYTGLDATFTYDATAIAGTWETVATPLAVGRNVIPLPAGQRKYDYLSYMAEIGAPLLRFAVAAGTITIDRVMLQIEPPDGLKVQSGHHMSDWITPPIVKKSARTQTTNENDGAQSATYVTGDYNPPLTQSPSDRTWVPNGHDTVVEAWNAMTVQGTQDSGVGYSTSLVIGAGWSANTDGNSATDGTNDQRYWAQASRSSATARGVWEEFPTFRQNPTLSGIKGRDYVAVNGETIAWNPNQVTQTTGWNPGALKPKGSYLQETWPGDGQTHITNSPHGEVINVTGVQSFSVTAATPVNYPQYPGFDGYTDDGSVQFEVAPPPGSDITFSVTMMLDKPVETSPPVGQWAEYASYVTNMSTSMQVAWMDKTYDPGTNRYRLSAIPPQLLLQQPDYQLYVPDFTLSPDAIIPQPPQILPIPGEILTPVQDIAVTAGDVAVNFATT